MHVPANEISNPIFHELADLGVVDSTGGRILNRGTRDSDIPVLIDDRSGVIFLQHAETSTRYYETEKTEDLDQSQFITTLTGNQSIRTMPLEDDARRFEQTRDLSAGQAICDFGCGYGGYLRLNRGHAACVAGVELRDHCLAHIRESAPEITVRKRILDFDAPFDLVTMFHVLEHIPTQVDALRDIRRRLAPGGKVLVEVPHAGDFLIRTLDVPAFRGFTFWSEHLVLHTAASLDAVLKSAGFADIDIRGYQRYGFTNHLGWLVGGKPCGHETMKSIARPDMESAYRRYLSDLGATDTLIAVARPDAP